MSLRGTRSKDSQDDLFYQKHLAMKRACEELGIRYIEPEELEKLLGPYPRAFTIRSLPQRKKSE